LPSIRLRPSFSSSSDHGRRAEQVSPRSGRSEIEAPRHTSKLSQRSCNVVSSLATWSLEAQWHSVGQKTKMYNPTSSPSRTEPTSSHCVLVIDAPPASHFTENQQV